MARDISEDDKGAEAILGTMRAGIDDGQAPSWTLIFTICNFWEKV